MSTNPQPAKDQPASGDLLTMEPDGYIDTLASSTDVETRVSAWLPINSAAPHDGTPFYATGLNHGREDAGRHYCVAWWDANRGHYVEGPDDNPESCGILLYLTHWQPLITYP